MDDQDKRIEIDEIPKAAEELSDEEAKEVQGGTFYGRGVLKSTDGGNSWTASTNTVGGTLSND
jgi:hypothetical protein